VGIQTLIKRLHESGRLKIIDERREKLKIRRVIDGRRLEVFHKVNGQWKVIHTHISAPMDPKTGMTEMNLKS
jgi:hypothetical protein